MKPDYDEILIQTQSDESVGIFSQRFTIEGDFFFDEDDQKKSFIEALKDAFEIITGDRVSIKLYNSKGEFEESNYNYKESESIDDDFEFMMNQHGL